jgi:hypothetical protein
MHRYLSALSAGKDGSNGCCSNLSDLFLQVETEETEGIVWIANRRCSALLMQIVQNGAADIPHRMRDHAGTQALTFFG